MTVAAAFVCVLAFAWASLTLGYAAGQWAERRKLADSAVFQTGYRLGQAQALYEMEAAVTGTPVLELIEQDRLRADGNAS